MIQSDLFHVESFFSTCFFGRVGISNTDIIMLIIILCRNIIYCTTRSVFDALPIGSGLVASGLTVNWRALFA